MKPNRSSVVLWVGAGMLVASLLACAGGGPAQGGGATQPPATSAGQAAPAACDTPSDDFVNLAGQYTVKGGKADQTGGNYTGDATITQVSKNCFNIVWRLDGGRTRSGTLQAYGNLFGGAWQEGSQSGVFNGSASLNGKPGEDHLSLGWGVGTSEEHNADYLEILMKQ